MRNYDEEIRKLNCDIERLSIEKNKKESQLKSVLREQKENEKQSSKILKDQAGVPIEKGDWVRTVTIGRFNTSEGTVVNLQKWVTFEDCTGVKQVRASHNVLVSNDDRKRARHVTNTHRDRKPEPSSIKQYKK